MHHSIIHIPFVPVSCEVASNTLSIKADHIAALENCKPALYWRYAGDEAWQYTVAETLNAVEPHADSLCTQAQLGSFTAMITFSWSANPGVLRMSGTLTSHETRAVELARFCYLTGELPNEMGFLGLEGPTEKPILRHHGDVIAPYRKTVEDLWMSMGVQWPRLPDTIHDSPGWAVSKDVAAFIPDWHSAGWGIGFTGPGTAFGEIGYHAAGEKPDFYVGVLLDNIVIEPGEERRMESAIMWYGDWQQGLKLWARCCAEAADVSELRPPLTGYCSWYQTYNGITPDEILRAANEFAGWPTSMGGRTIQIDDGFQVSPGNWLPNERFAETWTDLPGDIARTGSIPGIWLAPTMVHEAHPMVQNHPDWIQRVGDDPAIYFSNWGKTFVMEPDHPEVKRFIADILNDYVAQGWRYFKLDFTYPVSTARKAWDRKKTSFETLKELYALMRACLGDDILLSACIGIPGRYALGNADFARLGGDIGSSWGAVMQTVRAWLVWSCTHGVWWQGDPDVFMMRSENSSLSFEESSLLTGTIGLFGGMFLTLDFPSQWSDESKSVVLDFWQQIGTHKPYDYRICWDGNQNVRAYRVSTICDDEMRHTVGIYNWSEEASDITVSLADIGLSADISWRLDSEAVEYANGRLTVKQQPPHSLRIGCLTA